VNEATDWTTGVKISLYNITDPENPVETFSFVDQNAPTPSITFTLLDTSP
jgi:uncharacterized secreted protein with C-terminal beta-propeller domain